MGIPIQTLLYVAERIGAWATGDSTKQSYDAAQSLQKGPINSMGNFTSSKILSIRRLLNFRKRIGKYMDGAVLRRFKLACISLRFKGCTWIIVDLASTILFGPAGSSSVTWSTEYKARDTFIKVRHTICSVMINNIALWRWVRTGLAVEVAEVGHCARKEFGGKEEFTVYNTPVVAHAPPYLVIIRLQIRLPQHGTASQPPIVSQGNSPKAYKYNSTLRIRRYWFTKIAAKLLIVTSKAMGLNQKSDSSEQCAAIVKVIVVQIFHFHICKIQHKR